MKKIGIILTPDVRSKAYLSKLVDNKVKLNQIIFMNDDREEKKFSNKEINQVIRPTKKKNAVTKLPGWHRAKGNYKGSAP